MSISIKFRQVPSQGYKLSVKELDRSKVNYLYELKKKGTSERALRRICQGIIYFSAVNFNGMYNVIYIRMSHKQAPIRNKKKKKNPEVAAKTHVKAFFADLFTRVT